MKRASVSAAGHRAAAYTVVYDGACAVCQRSAALLRKRGGDLLEVLPYQTPGLRARFPWIPAPAYERSVQLIGPGGETWQGAEAVEQVLNVLPRGRRLAWLFRLPLARWIADRFYRWFARNRYRLACVVHCAREPAGLDYTRDSS